MLGLQSPLLLKDEYSFERNAIKKKYKSGVSGKRRILKTDVIIAQKGKRGMNAILSVFGGVFEKGSLANERNRFTFLSNLVRTSLACSIWRAPHLNSVRFTRKKRQRQARSTQRPWGWNASRQNRLCWRCKGPGEACGTDPCLSAEFSRGLLVIFFCPSNYWAGQQEPHNPAVAPAPDRESGMKAGVSLWMHLASSTTAHH